MTCSDVNETLLADGNSISSLLKKRVIDRVKSGLSWALARTPFAESGQESPMYVMGGGLVPKQLIGGGKSICQRFGVRRCHVQFL